MAKGKKSKVWYESYIPKWCGEPPAGYISHSKFAVWVKKMSGPKKGSMK